MGGTEQGGPGKVSLAAGQLPGFDFEEGKQSVCPVFQGPVLRGALGGAGLGEGGAPSKNDA